VKGHFAPVHDWEKFKPTETMWVSVELWDDEAKTHCKSIAKGRTLSGLGHLLHDKWVDKVTGEDRKKFKVRFTKVLPLSAELDSMLQTIGLPSSEAAFNARDGAAAEATDSGFSSQFPDDSDQDTEFREFKQAPANGADNTNSNSYSGSNSYSTANSDTNSNSNSMATPGGSATPVKSWFKPPAGTSFGLSNGKSNSMSSSNSNSLGSSSSNSNSAFGNDTPAAPIPSAKTLFKPPAGTSFGISSGNSNSIDYNSEQQRLEDERRGAEIDNDDTPVVPSGKTWKPRTSSSSESSSGSSGFSSINSGSSDSSDSDSGDSYRINSGPMIDESEEPGADEPEPELTWDLVEQNIDDPWSNGD
jgi:hypothetical protein